MRSWLLAAVAVLAVLAAAALALPWRAATPTSHGPSAAQTPTVPNPLGPNGLALAGCVGWSAVMPLLSPLVSAPRPTGWEPASPDAVPKVVLTGLRCDRLAMGPFERGPVRLVLEAHTDVRWPPACLQGQTGHTEFGVLANAWVDDPEIAAYLRAAYGVPARPAAIQDGLPTQGLHEWTWQEPDAAPSSLRVAEDLLTPTANPWAHRLFWADGDGLAGWEVAFQSTGATGERPSSGHLEAPALLAQQGGAFAGDGEWFSSLEGQGAFLRYASTDCTGSA